MANVTESTIDRFRPQRVNRNKHKERGMGALESSMRKLGYVAPMTAAANGEVIDGSARLETSAIVFDDDVLVVEHDGQRPIVMVRTDIPNADTPEARQIAIAANRVAQLNLDFDVEGLLADAASGLDLTGLFAQSELDEMLAELTPPNVGADTETQIDKADELRKVWGVELGQLWQLGPHRLACGDCTDLAVVERLMGGERADMMFTDPPYGVNYTGGHFHSGNVNIKREREELAGDKTPVLYADFLPIVLPFVDGPCYMWFADRTGKPVYDAVIENRCEIHAMIIWHKTNATYAAMNAQYKQRHEPLLYFKPKGSTLRWCGPTDECTIWEIDRDAKNEYHPTQKPTALAERAMKNHEATTVADFFAGSGSTLIACHNLNRRGFGVEISPSYCAVILQRFLDHTGQQPVLLEA